MEEHTNVREDLGYQTPQESPNTRATTYRILPKTSGGRISSGLPRLPVGMVRIRFLKGEMAGAVYVYDEDRAAKLVAIGRAERSDNQSDMYGGGSYDEAGG